MRKEIELDVYGDTNVYTQEDKQKVAVGTPCECGCDDREGKTIGYLYIIHDGKLNGIKFKNKKDVGKLIDELYVLLI